MLFAKIRNFDIEWWLNMMTVPLKPLFWVTVLLVLLQAFPKNAQANTGQADSTKGKQHTLQKLELARVGHGMYPNGHSFIFRIYVLPDGTEGRIVYAQLPSHTAAQQQIADWLKLVTKILKRQGNASGDRESISERVVAERRTTNSSKGEFMIIRRDDLNCYLIESASFEMALQVEALIQHD